MDELEKYLEQFKTTPEIIQELEKVMDMLIVSRQDAQEGMLLTAQANGLRNLLKSRFLCMNKNEIVQMIKVMHITENNKRRSKGSTIFTTEIKQPDGSKTTEEFSILMPEIETKISSPGKFLTYLMNFLTELRIVEEYSDASSKMETLKHCLLILSDQLTPEHYSKLFSYFHLSENIKLYGFFFTDWENCVLDWIETHKDYTSIIKMIDFSPNNKELLSKILTRAQQTDVGFKPETEPEPNEAEEVIGRINKHIDFLSRNLEDVTSVA